MPFLGELSAITAALCWTINSLTIERLGKGFSPWALNALTKLGGLIGLIALMFFMNGHALARASASQWLLLLFSGLLGFSLGDGFLFAAFQSLGAKKTMLVFSANPILTALFGWLFLNENLSSLKWLGILLAITGIMWVIQSDMGKAANGQKNRGQAEQAATTAPWQGLVFAALATIGQSGGALLSKAGLASLDAVSASQIRLVGGVIGMALMLSFMKQWPQVTKPLKHKKGLITLTVSVVLGTLVGMVLSMQAIKLTQVAVASILMSLMPVMILPISHFILKDRVTLRETLGVIITLFGVVLLFV